MLQLELAYVLPAKMVSPVVVVANNPIFDKLTACVKNESLDANVAVNCAVVLPTFANVALLRCVLAIISPGNVVAAAPGAAPVPNAM